MSSYRRSWQRHLHQRQLLWSYLQLPLLSTFHPSLSSRDAVQSLKYFRCCLYRKLCKVNKENIAISLVFDGWRCFCFQSGDKIRDFSTRFKVEGEALNQNLWLLILISSSNIFMRETHFWPIKLVCCHKYSSLACDFSSKNSRP